MGLRTLRKAAGLTLQQLAEKSGVHFVKIQQIETGKIKPENITLRNAIKLAKALNCRPEDIMHDEK